MGEPANDSLRPTEARLAEAQRVANMGSWEWDVAADEVTWSDQLYRIYGLAPGECEITFARYLEKVHAEDRDRVMELVVTGLADRRPFSFEERVLRPDGEVRVLRSCGQALLDDDGNVVRVVGACQDVTEERLAAAARQAAEERFRRTFECSGIGMAVVGLAPDRLLEVNQRLCEITGYERERLLEMTFTSLVHPDGDRPELSALDRVFADGSESVAHELRCVHARGDPIWVEVTTSLVHEADGTPQYRIAQVQDISTRKRFQLQLQHLADHDPLTGLFNRRRFRTELDREIAVARRYGGAGSVLALDLDDFKYVNDSLGHAAGDELIARVAAIFSGRLRATDVIARLGGDEFGVILPRIDEKQSCVVAESLRAAVSDQVAVEVGERTRRVTVSIGIAPFHDLEGSIGEQLLVEADLAMYKAKESGRDSVAVYAPDRQGTGTPHARPTWVERLRGALEQDAFVLHAQPILSLNGDARARWELLLRLKEGDAELIPPHTFLGVAERFGLAPAIDRWVVRRAIGILAEQQRAGHHVHLEVNLSAMTICDGEIADFIAEQLGAAGVDPRALCFEVTETAAIVNVERARDVARELAELGCEFALDDFGAGFASFYYLKHLVFDYIKIDGEFIADLSSSPTNQLIVRAVVDIAKGMGKRTIAEHVGDQPTLALLRELGVDYAQGFGVAVPAPIETLDLASLGASAR